MLICRKSKRSIKLINRSFTVANMIQLKKTEGVQEEYEFSTSPKSKAREEQLLTGMDVLQKITSWRVGLRAALKLQNVCTAVYLRSMACNSHQREVTWLVTPEHSTPKPVSVHPPV